MVGVINPNASTSLVTHRDVAFKSAFSLNPGDPFPEESETLPSSPSSSPDTISTSAPSNPNPSSKPPLSTGAIAGIAVGGVVVIAVAAALFYIDRSCSLKQALAQKTNTLQRVNPPSPMLQAHFTRHHHSPHPLLAVSPYYAAGEALRSDLGYVTGARSLPPGFRGSGVERSASFNTQQYDYDSGYNRVHDALGIGVISPQPPQGHWDKPSKTSAVGFPFGAYGRQMAGEEGLPGYGSAVNEGRPAEMDGVGLGQEGGVRTERLG